jgi:GAF domain-containing protein
MPFPVDVERGVRAPETAWRSTMSILEPTAASTGEPRAPATELQELLLATEDVEGFLQELVHIAAGVTVARNGHPATVVSSDTRASQCDEVQYGHDDGPCLTAMRANKVVLIDDLAQDDRFTKYRPFALALGVRSSLSLPLRGGNDSIGALNLYSWQPSSFGASEQVHARRFADEASRALDLVVHVAHHVEITAQLRAALMSRTVIDQSIGIIMSQNTCDADAAFALLRAAAQTRNVPLRMVAAEILVAVTVPAPTDPAAS